MDRSWKVTKNKTLEVVLDFGWDNNLASEWFELALRTRSKQDHWGIYFEFCLLRFVGLHITFFDNRHWDYDNACPKQYDEDEYYI